MTTTTLWVDDMHCANCSTKISSALQQMPGIHSINVNPVQRRLFVDHDNTVASQDLVMPIESLGFNPKLIGRNYATDHDNRALLKRLGIAGLCMMQVMMLQLAMYAGLFQGMAQETHRLLSYAALIFSIPVVAYCAVPFFVKGITRLNMDTPIALAIGIAFAVSAVNTWEGRGEVYFDSVVMFTFLMLGARYLDQRLRHKLQVQDSALASLPHHVQQFIGDTHKLETHLLSTIKTGDRLWIGAGQLVPADGQLASATALIDEATLTGESIAATHAYNDTLYAGTTNLGTGFELLVSHEPSESRLVDIETIANQAAAQKSKLTGLADAIARIFVPFVLFAACATYLFWMSTGHDIALSAALAVLVVSCPCALSLAVPAAITAALTRLRRAGVLVRNTRAIEIAAKISRTYFDKTGTLTQAQPSLVSTKVIGPTSEEKCLSYAAALQLHSNHPLAKPFHPFQSLPARDISIFPGHGVAGMVETKKVRVGDAEFCGWSTKQTPGTLVYLSVENIPSAVFTLENPLREDAQSTFRELRGLGIQTHIVSGDNGDNCANIANQLATDFVSSASPEQKLHTIRQASIAAENSAAPNNEIGFGPDKCMFIGDGLNDLPALASADISVATMETMDLVKSKADVVLMNSKLAPIVELIVTGRAVTKVITQNLVWAACYNALAIPLAIAGIAPPWLAALGMSVSSLAVMANSTRLLYTPRSS